MRLIKQYQLSAKSLFVVEHKDKANASQLSLDQWCEFAGKPTRLSNCFLQ